MVNKNPLPHTTSATTSDLGVTGTRIKQDKQDGSNGMRRGPLCKCHSQRVQSTHIGNTYPNHEGNYYVLQKPYFVPYKYSGPFGTVKAPHTTKGGTSRWCRSVVPVLLGKLRWGAMIRKRPPCNCLELHDFTPGLLRFFIPGPKRNFGEGLRSALLCLSLAT